MHNRFLSYLIVYSMARYTVRTLQVYFVRRGLFYYFLFYNSVHRNPLSPKNVSAQTASSSFSRGTGD